MAKIRPPGRRLIAKFYRTSDGTQPVREFIELQKAAVQLAIERQIGRLNLLNENQPHLAFPYSSQIEGELRELRCHYGSALYRILYRRSEQFVKLLHIFEKRDGLVSEEDKQVARERWNDFRKRMDTSLGSGLVRSAGMRRATRGLDSSSQK